MSFWKKTLGLFKKETQIIKEPEHDLATRPSDDLRTLDAKNDKLNNLNDEKEELNNKSSP